MKIYLKQRLNNNILTNEKLEPIIIETGSIESNIVGIFILI